MSEPNPRWLKTVNRRLRLLGLTQEQFLHSEHWVNLCRQYLATVEGCEICGSEAKVYHRTYRRLGEEKMSDLIALCDKHRADFMGRLKDRTRAIPRTSLNLVTDKFVKRILCKTRKPIN
jgi:hypothetical protein